MFLKSLKCVTAVTKLGNLAVLMESKGPKLSPETYGVTSWLCCTCDSVLSIPNILSFQVWIAVSNIWAVRSQSGILKPKKQICKFCDTRL